MLLGKIDISLVYDPIHFFISYLGGNIELSFRFALLSYNKINFPSEYYRIKQINDICRYVRKMLSWPS